MPALDDYACEGTLTIGGILMNRPAWAIMADQNGNGGLLQLLTTTDIRGEDRIVPGAPGVIPYRRRITVTRYSLRLLVTGDVDETGVVNADSKIGLVENLDYLWDNVITPPLTGESLRAASWLGPDGATRTANIHVVRCDQTRYVLSESSTIWEGLLIISIPTGRFT